MPLHRHHLPQLERNLVLTDGGIETTLMFHHGVALPDFAVFPLLRNPAHRTLLRDYFLAYTNIAQRFGAQLFLNAPTWRANPDWATRLGYKLKDLPSINREAVEFLEKIREETMPFIIGGCIGPRGDGYVPATHMTIQQAADYHRLQVDAFAASNADIIAGVTMNYPEEAAGIAIAAREAGVPVTISFTLETDGKLPGDVLLADVIDEVDARTSGYPAYYMINCAHPEHFEPVLSQSRSHDWVKRIRGIRANASRMSHSELNESATLDIGNPEELGHQLRALASLLPNLTVLGGCCGTDHRHIEHIAQACQPLFMA